MVATPDGADASLTQMAWLLKVKDVASLRHELARRGIRVEQFKQLPAYRENLERMPWLAEL
jgi:hypothetical protein